jgi:hypothetical protein
VQLEQGNFQHGWSNYESRLQSEEHRRTGFRRDLQSVLRFEELQRWKGPTQSGIGRVAIWAEQGIGDEILFSTLIPDLIYSGTWFVYEIDARLIAAYRRAFPNASFVERSDPPAAELQNGDYVLAAGSLPRLFRTSCRDFERQPRALVQALPERVAHYRQELAALGRGLKVALSWHSARGHWWARRKNVALGSLTPLLQVAGAHFVDVQYGDTADERARVEAAAGVSIKRFDSVDHFHDLEDVMAILEACDLVITTSNVTAHLAGVIGKRTWVLFPGHRPPFHYWAHRGDHRSPWYPSVEIVSAPEPGDWTSVVRGVAQKLSRSI